MLHENRNEIEFQPFRLANLIWTLALVSIDVEQKMMGTLFYSALPWNNAYETHNIEWKLMGTVDTHSVKSIFYYVTRFFFHSTFICCSVHLL